MSKQDEDIKTSHELTESTPPQENLISDFLKTKLISIDQQRVENFLQRNPHIKINDQTLGAKEEVLSEKEIDLIVTRQIANAARQVRGSIGNAHSIFLTLKECISDSTHRLILEDDTQLHPDLRSFVIENWDAIKILDLLVLGGNTDAVMTFEAINGMPLSSTFLRKQDKHPDYPRINKIFSTTPTSAVTIYKLHKIFGSHAWIVSPVGAKKLIDKCFPLDAEPIDIPLLPHRLLGISFDRRWNAILGEIDAGLCVPFLAMTPNNAKSRRPDS